MWFFPMLSGVIADGFISVINSFAADVGQGIIFLLFVFLEIGTPPSFVVCKKRFKKEKKKYL